MHPFYISLSRLSEKTLARYKYLCVTRKDMVYAADPQTWIANAIWMQCKKKSFAHPIIDGGDKVSVGVHVGHFVKPSLHIVLAWAMGVELDEKLSEQHEQIKKPKRWQIWLAARVVRVGWFGTRSGKAVVAKNERPDKWSTRDVLAVNSGPALAEDIFNIDHLVIPNGVFYEWKRWSVAGVDDKSYCDALKRRGWSPVPAARHPELVSETTDGDIVMLGMALMEKDAGDAAEEQIKAIDKALSAVSILKPSKMP